MQFICVGTHFGWIYLLDHQGNSVRFKENLPQGFNAHSISVNQISVDVNGDFIASCSDDGKVYILLMVHIQYSSLFFQSYHNYVVIL